MGRPAGSPVKLSLRGFLRGLLHVARHLAAQLTELLSFIGALLCLIYFLLNSSFTAQIFDEAVNPMFRGGVHWQRLRFGPMPWQLRILGVELLGPDGQAVVTADELHIEELRLLELLKGRISAQQIRLVRPHVHLKQRPHAELKDDWGQPAQLFNIEELFMPPGVPVEDGELSDPPPLEFDEVQIEQARVILDLEAIAIVVEGALIEQARFSLVDDLMQMRAQAVRVAQVQVSLPSEDEAGPPLHAPAAQLWRWPLRDVQITHFLWHQDAFQVAQLKATVFEDDPLILRDLHMDLDRPGLPWVRTQLTYETRQVERSLGQFGLDDVRGAVRVSLRAQGELDALEAAGEIFIEDAQLPGDLQVEALRLDLRKTEADLVEIPALDLRAYGGQVRGRAFVDLLRGQASAALWGEDLDLSRLPIELPGIAEELAEGPARLRLDFNGVDLFEGADALRAHAALKVDLQRSHGGSTGFGLGQSVQLDLLADYVKGRLDLGHLRLNGRSVKVQSEGLLSLAGGDDSHIEARVQAKDLQSILAAFDVPLRGGADLQLKVHGSLLAPKVELTARADRLLWPELPPVGLQTKILFDVGTMRATVRDLRVSTPAGRVQSSGWVDLARATPRFDLRLSTRGLRLDRLPLPEDLALAGLADLSVRATGSLTRPRVALDLTLSEPQVRGLALKTVRVKGSYAQERIEIEQLSVADAQRERLSAQGWFVPKTQAFEGAVHIDRLSPSLIEPLIGEALPVSGYLSLDLEGKGHLSAPEGQGQLRLEQVQVADLSLKDSTLQLTAGEGRARLTGNLAELIALQVDAPTAVGGAPGTLEVQVFPLKVEDYVPALAKAGASAQVEAKVSAQFDAFKGEVSDILLELPTLSLGYTERDRDGQVIRPPRGRACEDCASVQVDAVEPVRLSWREDRAFVESLKLRLGRRTLEVTGSASPTDLDLAVGGNIDLGALWPFLRSVFTDVQGQVELDLKVRGQPATPQLEGFVTLQQANLVPRSAVIGGELDLAEAVSLQVVPPAGPAGPEGALPSGVFSVTLPARKADGSANRFILLRDDAPVELTVVDLFFEGWAPSKIAAELRTDEAELELPRMLSATVSTPGLRVEMWDELNAMRQVEPRLLISGHVDLLRAEYVADISSASEIGRGVGDNLRGRSAVRTVSAFERTPLLRNLELDLSIRGNDEIYVRNKVTVLDLNLAVALDLHRVSGMIYPQGAKPLTIEGRVDVLQDSQITYARRPFDVTLGSVVFRSEKFMTADVEATHTFRLRTDRGGQAGTFDRGASGDVREEEVILKVAVVIEQLSTPPKIDLNLSSSSGASKIEVATLVLTGSYPSDLTGAASAAPATEVLLAPVLSLIEAPLQQTLDVDLSLTPATTGTLFIDADKLLSRRLRLYTRTPVGDDANNSLQTFGLEYRLNNEVTLEATNERLGNLNSTGGRMRLRLLLD